MPFWSKVFHREKDFYPELQKEMDALHKQKQSLKKEIAELEKKKQKIKNQERKLLEHKRT